MAVESVTFITDFVTTNPVGATDTVATLDDHIRNMKIGIGGTFPNFTGIAMTATEAELNNLDGYTGNTADLNVIAGANAAGITPTELSYLNGVTSALQTQLNARLVAASNLSDLANAGTARTNLGLGALAVLGTINNGNWSGTDLALVNGGTGSSTAAGARTNLGIGALGALDTLTPELFSGLTAGSVILYADATIDNSNSTSYVIAKSVYCPAGGTVSVVFDLRSQNVGVDTAYGRIYVNGGAVGTERTDTDATYTTQASENITVSAGDLIQLYVRNNTGGSSNAYVQNFIISAASGFGFVNQI